MAKNYLTYPLKNMNVSQTYSGSTSHMPHTQGYPKDYPWDESGKDTGREYMYCPCDEMKVVRIYGVGNTGTNTIWLESTSKVVFADGTEDYVSLMVIHPNDDDLSRLSVGQVFHRGDIICKEGKDGRATGNHFHFSAGKGKVSGTGWVENSKKSYVLTTQGGTYPPEKLFYIDKSFTSVVSTKGLPFKSLTGETLTYGTPETSSSSNDATSFSGTDSTFDKPAVSITYESKVIPRRVNDSGDQPLLAFVDLYVGDKYLTFTPPQYVVSLEVSKLGDSTMSFILTVFDDNWDDLEELFSRHSDNIKLKYGIVGGKESKTFNLAVTDYSIRFNTAGAMLSIKGNSTGVVDNMTRVTLNTMTTNPTESVKTICRTQGWTVLDKNFEPSEDIHLSTQDHISLINDYPITYIKYHLAPLAIRKSDGETGYVFHLDDTTSPPTAYFGVHEITESAHKTYIYMRGLNSPVIDLDISMNEVLGGIEVDRITTEMEATFIDPETKEKVTISEDINSIRKSVVGEFSHTRAKQSKKVVDAAGASRSQMNAILPYRLSTSMPYTGTLKIVGDPDININDVIRLIIITDKGNLHHSSGLYIVMEATDSIFDGSLTTTVSILRHEDIEEGLEIVNYRTLLK